MIRRVNPLVDEKLPVISYSFQQKTFGVSQCGNVIY